MNYILGGGMTGLTIALYFKTFSILARGKGQDADFLGLRVLRRNDAVDRFIKKFVVDRNGKSPGSRIFKVGYLLKGEAVDSLKDKEKKKELEERVKMNDWLIKEDWNKDIEGYNMVEVYRELVNRFDLRTRKVFLNIKKINNNKRIISGNNPIHKQIKIALLYNQLINTLPVMLFNSLVEGEFVKVINSQLYICLLESDDLVKRIGDFDFVYFIDDTPYFRLTKIGENKFAIESEKVFLPKNEFSFSCKIFKTFPISFGRINEKAEPIEIDNVIHVGRNAVLNQAFRIDKLIEMLENKEIRL